MLGGGGFQLGPGTFGFPGGQGINNLGLIKKEGSKMNVNTFHVVTHMKKRKK